MVYSNREKLFKSDILNRVLLFRIFFLLSFIAGVWFTKRTHFFSVAGLFLNKRENKEDIPCNVLRTLGS